MYRTIMYQTSDEKPISKCVYYKTLNRFIRNQLQWWTKRIMFHKPTDKIGSAHVSRNIFHIAKQMAKIGQYVFFSVNVKY